MAEGFSASDQIITKLNTILETLKRIEERQVRTTAMVTEVKAHEAPVTGSFGASDFGEGEKEKKK